jgi:hypothetical protein
MKVLAVAALLVVGAVAINPKFPNDWSAVNTDAIVINQGGTLGPDGSICCSPTSPQCKIQSAYQQGTQYWSVTDQKTAFKAPDGSGTVAVYADGKEYSVDASGACQEYCPLEETKLTAFSIGPNATDDGMVNYNGQQVHMWNTSQKVPIFGTVQSTNWYAKQAADGTFIPIAQITHITPFGEDLGQENSTFLSFKAGNPPASVFTVTGTATCKQAKGCNGEDDDGGQDDGPSAFAMRQLKEAEPVASAESFLTAFKSTMKFNAYSNFVRKNNQ